MKSNKKLQKNKNMSSVIGENIRFFRKKQGLNLQYLASKISVSPQQLQKYETGVNRVSAEKLYEISLILKIPINQFFVQFNIKNSPDNQDEARFLLEQFNKIHSSRIKKQIIKNILFYSEYGT